MPRKAYSLALAVLVAAAACNDATGPKRSCAGPRLLFAETGGPSGIQVETANGDGSGQAVLLQTTPGASEAAWSPDGCQIAYTQNLKLFIANADGSNARAIFTGTSPLDYPAWRPDGSQLLVNVAARVWRVRSDGLAAAPLTSDTLPAWSGRWSSDGTLIAYIRGGSSLAAYPTVLVVINADGSAARVVSDSANQGPAWIPGTHRVAYGHYIATPSGTNGSELRSVNADGTDDRLIASGLPNPFDLAWTPGADTLYFDSEGPTSQNFGNSTNIYMVKADGSGFGQVITGQPDALRPNTHP